MTTPTPEQMRALADGPIATSSEKPSDVMPTMHDVRAALRAAADSVDQWIRVAAKLSDRIDEAPHGRLCGSFSWNSNGTGWDHKPENCNCWKSDAL